MATHSNILLEDPMDRGAWWAAVYRVAQSQTRLKRLSHSSSRRIKRYFRTVLVSRTPGSHVRDSMMCI